MKHPYSYRTERGALALDSLRRQTGLTLVELMVSLGLGLLLVSAVGSVYLGSTQTFRTSQESSRIQETGRYAFDVIGRSLRHAGYAPMNYVGPAIGPVRGTDGSGGAPDTITTQRGWDKGDRSCVDATGQENQLVQEIFRIDTVNAELECEGTITPDPSGGSQPFLSRVEDLQILYGIDIDEDPYASANQYLPEPAPTSSWDDVVSVRVCILVQSEEEGVGPLNPTYLTCAGALNPGDPNALAQAGDTRLRRTFVATFALRNRITAIP